MSDSEEENYAIFGVALDPLDEENIPKKKPMTIEDQYAYDSEGRRRFHGAFTGGFSAGYFNTVGTRDGWRPQQFKSCRSNKADSVTQRPEDFMDEEDTSLFGIAPKGIRATSDYAVFEERGKKRKPINQDNTGPIPGIPVLRELVKPVRETIGIGLLKKMGWKPGQGVGSRLTNKEKQKMKQRNERLRLAQENPEMIFPESNSDDSDDDMSNVTFAPDDYEPFRCKPKDNYFGIGYCGLDRRTILSNYNNIFGTPAFCVQDKNKKLSIHGQAFGVGAFEADDEDIYEREDMSRYDFSLDPERKAKTRWSQDGSNNLQINCLEGFTRMKKKLENKKIFKLSELPKDFAPVHAVRKSRFYPPIVIPVENGKRREPLNAVDRARILEDPNDHSNTIQKPQSSTSVASNIISKTLNLHGKQQTEERKKLESQQTMVKNSWLDKLNMHNFIKGSIVESKQDTGSLKNLEDFKEISVEQSIADKSVDNDSSNKSEAKKLFLSDPDKQKRFEQYLIFSKNNTLNKFESIQPLSMTDWEREQERLEFEQVAKFESNDYMANKFVCSTDSTDKTDSEKIMKEAVKLKMFGKLTRIRTEWKPASIVCKRFNIPEPKVGCAPAVTDRKSTKFSIFDSLDMCSSFKFTKATDTIKSQTQEVSPLSEKTRESEAIHNISPNNIPSNMCQSLESKKFNTFETSYEKVFGKDIQGTSVTSHNIKQDTQNILKDKNIQKIENNQQEIASETSMLKNQSEEKKDLFKAIFLSSSEDSDSESEQDTNNEAVKSILIGKEPPKPKSAKELNMKRNTSPPRGIFANVDLDSLMIQPIHSNVTSSPAASKVSESLPIIGQLQNNFMNNSNMTADTSQTQILPNIYGPVLPERLLKQQSADNETTTEDCHNVDQVKLMLCGMVSKSLEDPKLGGKWVERDKLRKKEKEKKKKRKHKHKELKTHKHKKKSKKEKRSKH